MTSSRNSPSRRGQGSDCDALSGRSLSVSLRRAPTVDEAARRPPRSASGNATGPGPGPGGSDLHSNCGSTRSAARACLTRRAASPACSTRTPTSHRRGAAHNPPVMPLGNQSGHGIRIPSRLGSHVLLRADSRASESGAGIASVYQSHGPGLELGLLRCFRVMPDIASGQGRCQVTSESGTLYPSCRDIISESHGPGPCIRTPCPLLSAGSKSRAGAAPPGRGPPPDGRPTVLQALRVRSHPGP